MACPCPVDGADYAPFHRQSHSPAKSCGGENRKRIFRGRYFVKSREKAFRRVGAGEDVDVGMGALASCLGDRYSCPLVEKARRVTCPPDRVPTRGPTPHRSSPAPTRSRAKRSADQF